MRRSMSDKVFMALVYTVLLLITLLIAYPLYFMVIASFSDPAQVTLGKVVFWVKSFSLSGYKRVLENQNIWIGYRNTIIYTVCGTLLDVTVTTLAAYSLSRKDLVGRNLFTTFFTITMFFGGGLIPTYMVIKNLGLVNQPILMVLLGAVNVYNMIVARTFFSSTLPESLLEAAAIDGCGNGRFFVQIVLPLSKAILAVLAIYFASGHWNSYFNAMIYLTSRNYVPLQLVLRDLLISAKGIAQEMQMGAYSDADYLQIAKEAEAMKYCVVIVSSVPMLCAYPFVQKHFMQGVMLGAIKG